MKKTILLITCIFTTYAMFSLSKIDNNTTTITKDKVETDVNHANAHYNLKKHLDANSNINTLSRYYWNSYDKTFTVNTLEFKKTDKTTVYPNPSNNGVFNLIKPATWVAYNILGSEIAKGTGKIVNLNNFGKGIYLLYIESTILKLIVN